ncbi:hypothetical protein F443_01854 [Phytophthora nicotianae P1569]|uniref:Uncharacterized protein n=1 Tax=Phytophthora nicotianae P1569 TaxID=1317065 RepID=V9FYJ2_PHYNI|nr:hypothetical protein F443_01854 [Phytophthora nicotianae P1569]
MAAVGEFESLQLQDSHADGALRQTSTVLTNEIQTAGLSDVVNLRRPRTIFKQALTIIPLATWETPEGRRAKNRRA